MRYKLEFAGVVILLASGSCVAPHHGNKFGVLSPIERSVRAWQADNHIELREDAFRLLVEQAGIGCTNCTTTYHREPEGTEHAGALEGNASTSIAGKGSIQGNSPSTFKERTSSPTIVSPTGEFRQALYEYYLDQLRDIMAEKGKTVMEVSDIMANSFTAFLRDHGLSDGSSLQVGRLIVRSEPKAAIIIINDRRKGYTDKRFIVGAGRYKIKVTQSNPRFSCNETVLVHESEVITLICKPPK